MNKMICTLILSALTAGYAWADLSLPSIFSNRMVLQSGQPAPVWGKAEPGAEITVKFADQIKITAADSSGHWKIILDPMQVSSKPRKLRIHSTLDTQPLILFRRSRRRSLVSVPASPTCTTA